jgi:hypothetical protein
VELAEHPRAALARDLDRLLFGDIADEGGDAGVLGVKTMRADARVEIPW